MSNSSPVDILTFLPGSSPFSSTSSLSTAPSGPAFTPKIRDASSLMAKHYLGKNNNCQGFLLQCALVFGHFPCSFPDDTSKISPTVCSPSLLQLLTSFFAYHHWYFW
ncbi:hypothetical protein ATANTOWER_022747 [Ataeniobius toweri]|uniref:Uncharacterized protein n=1 Tax=Ataeniobius toweri TaxID=208326 RepID=A0ABU7BK69_9TELE|nr:hypothetical protein [Ataeniobius toweri]